LAFAFIADGFHCFHIALSSLAIFQAYGCYTSRATVLTAHDDSRFHMYVRLPKKRQIRLSPLSPRRRRRAAAAAALPPAAMAQRRHAASAAAAAMSPPKRHGFCHFAAFASDVTPLFAERPIFTLYFRRRQLS
jgi:hypothetical protein